MSTFVLVHGAWHGGWAWDQVRPILESHGHSVHTPTLIGLGERAHLISRDITLDTMIEDITQRLIDEELNDAILVGHSFAGAVISGVAEQVPDRIQQLVYLDASLPEGGESMFDCMSPEVVARRKLLSLETSGGLSLPIPTAHDLGILDDSQWTLVKDHLTPHPLSTYSSLLNIHQKPGDGFPCSYIVCTDPIYEHLAWSRERAETYSWPIIPIKTGHDAMISAPDSLSELLLSFAR